MTGPTDPQPSPTQRMLKFFDFEHLPPGLQPISEKIHDVAHWMERELPGGPEKTAGMRKLLEAKDALVRAAL